MIRITFTCYGSKVLFRRASSYYTFLSHVINLF